MAFVVPKTEMQSLDFQIHDFDTDVEVLRAELKRTGVTVVRLYTADHPPVYDANLMATIEEAM